MSGITSAQAQELVLAPMFYSVVVQHSPEIPSRQLESAQPPDNGTPSDRGAPGDRAGAGTRAVSLPVELMPQILKKFCDVESDDCKPVANNLS